MNVLILSAGGPAGYGSIKSLRDINFSGKIVSIDGDELAVGFHMSDKYYVVPNVDDKDYIPQVLKIVDKEKIDLILPTGSDVEPISKNAHLFEGKLFMSDYESIMDCTDKWRFYNKCKDKFPLPKTFKGEYGDLNNYIFKKPISGSGSRGCKKVNITDASSWREFPIPDMIYSEYLPGQEYTIDVLCDMKSNPLVVIPRKRLQVKAGISSKGEIIKDEFIEKSCYDICKFLKLKGPICLQMKEDSEGNPKFIEINPRLGGGTYFTTLAGINLLSIILDLVNGNKPKIPTPDLIKVVRYYSEIVI
tara:strand:- start:5238 stop:6149 length:912 start_codon:yes stop_codon:yes gene_type:complete